MNELALHQTTLEPVTSVRELIARYPKDYRARLSLAIECAGAGSYASTVAALALLRSLIGEPAACEYDARVYAAELAIRLGFGAAARELTRHLPTASRFHCEAMEAMRPAAQALPEHRPVFGAVEALVTTLLDVTRSWESGATAGGPTAALLVARDSRFWRYALDVEPAVPLAQAAATGFLCAEAHVGAADMQQKLAPLFDARRTPIVAAFLEAHVPAERAGYAMSCRTIEVEGAVISLGDARAWQLPVQSPAPVLPPVKQRICVVEWSLL